MMKVYFGLISLFSALNVIQAYDDQMIFPLQMPDVQPKQNETYFCTAFKMSRQEHSYIVEFIPHASKDTAHHILIYGCEAPGHYERDTPRAIWDCGEMSTHSSEFPRAPTCSKGSTIVYAWAMDAPKLVLPAGVGFKVGGSSGINFLVLQVHYASVEKFQNGETDNSGIVLKMLPMDTNLVTKRAGVLLLGTGGVIPRNSIEHMETSCKITEPVTLHPFAFRTHTHKLGTAVSGWKIDSNENWILVGRHDPQKPQMFYPIENDPSLDPLTVTQGDIMAARCTMNNTRPHDVYIGSTGMDEMCNFYMMYYIHGDRTLREKYCFTSGPPSYYWSSDPRLPGVPEQVDIEASKPE